MRRIERNSWIPEHNRPLVYWIGMEGDDPRDYAKEGYRPYTVVAKFKTEAEAIAWLDAAT